MSRDGQDGGGGGHFASQPVTRIMKSTLKVHNPRVALMRDNDDMASTIIMLYYSA